MALSGFVCQFETQFASIAYQLSEAEKEREYHTVTGTVGVWNSPNGYCDISFGRLTVYHVIRCVLVLCITDSLISAAAADNDKDEISVIIIIIIIIIIIVHISMPPISIYRIFRGSKLNISISGILEVDRLYVGCHTFSLIVALTVMAKLD